jgi:hypothetical protein
MEVIRGGVLVSLLGNMGCVYRRILGGGGGSSVITPDLKWVMVSILGSGMICSVGIWP